MEEQITKYYLIQNSEKALKHVDVFEIVSLLESGKLDGQSYIFDLRSKEWCLVKDIRVLRDTCFEFKDSPPRECPSFKPPHKLPHGEFSNEIDSDYEYLLQYALNLSSPVDDSKEEILEVMLEESESKLAEKENELLEVKSIHSEFEDIIFNLKEENSALNRSLLDLENEKIDCLKSIEEIKATSNRDMSVLKAQYQVDKDKYTDIEKLNFKLAERVKSLLYALKLEKSQREELKSLLSHKEKPVTTSTHSEELLSKAMDYMLRGPAGGEKELLEKKNSILVNEIKDIEKFYNNKIQKIKDGYSSELDSLRLSMSNEKSNYESLADERDEYENKLKITISENKELMQEIGDLREELSLMKIHESGDKKLRENYQILTSRFKKLEKSYELEVQKNKDSIAKKDAEANVSVKYIKDELNKSREEIETLQNELQLVTSERDTLYDEKSGHYESDTKVRHLVSNLRADNKQLIDKYNSLRDKTAKYKVAYNELSESFKKLKDDLEERNEQFSHLKTHSEETIESLKEKVDGANDIYSKKLQELEEAKDREKSLMLKIEEFKSIDVNPNEIELNNSSEKGDDEELNRLIGDAFEVSNERIWMVARDGETPTGPYDFSEIYNMKINGELDKKVKIKKGAEFYKTKSEIFELSVPVSTHGSGKNIRYFIKRSSMRVPFYELVTFEINGVEHRGYCTSLSLGGIFIELNKISDDFVVDKKGRVLFSAGALDNPFQCVAQVKNVSDARPKGIGLMFVDLPELAKDDITFYINNYINKTKQVA